LRVDEVELRRIHVALVSPFRTSLGAELERDVLLVRVIGPQSEGWAECVAPTEPLYTSEYVEGAHQVLRTHLTPRLLERADVSAAEVADLLRPVKGHRMAKAALETAVLDAELRQSGLSLGTHLGAVRDFVDAGVAIGIAASVPELVSAVERFVTAGYRRVKLKIQPGWDLEPVAAVRRQFEALALQVDGNGAYSAADASHLAGLDEFGLLLLEQPLAPEDLAGHAELARQLATPICLDESIVSAAGAVAAIQQGACSIINIKAGRVGGYLEAVRIHDVCADRGIPVWCGGMLETGIGRAANIALAALPNFTLPGDISASDRYYETDLTPPFVLEGGRLRVPSGPGIGVTPRLDVLARVTRSVERLARP
jgi:O-succinylbenzoate synthase